MRALFLLALPLLAACGADGAPTSPSGQSSPASDVVFSGEARVGVSSGG